jgi:predicted phosphodiesterase
VDGRRSSVADPLAEPARIALAGDWHMNGPWAAEAIATTVRTADPDVFIQLGDFGYTFDAEYLQAVDGALATAGVPLLFVDGNHESFPTLHRYPVRDHGLRRLTEHVWHLPRGFRWQWGDVRFVSLGGAYSVDRTWRIPGVSWWNDETVTPEQAARAIAGGPVDVLIAHDCPTGVVIPGIDDTSSPSPWPPVELVRAYEHRTLLRQVVDAVRPTTIWHGHYHRRYATTAELGYGPVTVLGLDCDGTTVADNVHVLDLGAITHR